MYEYKVLTQRDGAFKGTFNVEKLQQAVNAFAAEGWRIVSVVTAAAFGGSLLGGQREEMVMFLEREKK